MSTKPHTENLCRVLTDDLAAVLAEVKQRELDAGGFVHDIEVKALFDLLDPRVAEIVAALVDRAVTRTENLSAPALFEWLNGILAEKRSP